METIITLPSRVRTITDEGARGVFEIERLYPGYGHTIGNSLRRIMLSSLPGAAITHVRIEGVSHEFSTIEGVREDVLTMLLALKRVRFAVEGDAEEGYEVSLQVRGPKVVTAGDLKTPFQVRVLNPEQYLFEITSEREVRLDCTVQQGIGYVPRDRIEPKKAEVGTIVLDAAFSPIRRVNYEVENMRVGDRTDYNRLRFTIETDGTLSAREALQRAMVIMVTQLKAILGEHEDAQEELPLSEAERHLAEELAAGKTPDDNQDSETLPMMPPATEVHKTRIETLNLNSRIIRALTEAGIRTVGGLMRKRRKDLLAIEGVGEKAVEEIERVLESLGVSLKSDE